MNKQELDLLYKNDFMKPEVYHGDVIEAQDKYGEIQFMPRDSFGEYIESTLIEEHKEKFLARLSASGYLDCTEWAMFNSEQEAINYLAGLKDS